MEVTEGFHSFQHLRRPSYLTSLRASVSLQFHQRSEGLGLVRVMKWKTVRKSICNPAHGALFFTLNPGSGLNKTVCMHLFVLQTGNFYHANYLIKKKIITWSVWHLYLSLLLPNLHSKIMCSVSSGLSKVFVGSRWVHTLSSDQSEKCPSPVLVCSNIAQQVFFSLTMELICSPSFLSICSFSFIQYWISEKEGIEYVINR